MKDWARLLAIGLLLLVAALTSWDFLFWSGRFPPNCYIENVDVSCLTKYEALQKLKAAEVDASSIGPFYLDIEGRTIALRPSKIGLYISPHRTINNSSKILYRSNYVSDLFKRATNNYGKKIAPLALVVDENAYGSFLKGVAADIDTEMRDATFVLTADNKFRVGRERAGKQVDIARSVNSMKSSLNADLRVATVEIETIQPRVYAKDLLRYPPKYLLAEYTTYFGSHDSPNRVHNIKLASSRTNNYVICSGEVFSLLSILGDFTGDSGYKEAFVIYNGELAPQYGGGSCQIASTLYNAALLAGLDIVERYNHGIYFTIYPLGRDASVYSGSRDLKLRNNTYHPIFVKAFATDRKLSFMLYGTPTSKKVWFSKPMIFFENEKKIAYTLSTEEANQKISRALLSGEPFYTYVTVFQQEGGYTTEKTIISHYKLTGDRENVKIVRPEPE